MDTLFYKHQNTQLRVLTTEKTLYEGSVNCVTLPGYVSPFQVLKGHASFVSALTTGNITYISDGKPYHITVCGGLVEVRNNLVTVLVSAS